MSRLSGLRSPGKFAIRTEFWGNCFFFFFSLSHADHVTKFVVVMCPAIVCFVRFHNNFLELTECKYVRLILTFKAALQIIVWCKISVHFCAVEWFQPSGQVKRLVLVTTWSNRNCVTNDLIKKKKKKKKTILFLTWLTSCSNQLLNTCKCTVSHSSKYVVRCSGKLYKPERLLETNMSGLTGHQCISSLST